MMLPLWNKSEGWNMWSQMPTPGILGVQSQMLPQGKAESEPRLLGCCFLEQSHPTHSHWHWGNPDHQDIRGLGIPEAHCVLWVVNRQPVWV